MAPQEAESETGGGYKAYTAEVTGPQNRRHPLADRQLGWFCMTSPDGQNERNEPRPKTPRRRRTRLQQGRGRFSGAPLVRKQQPRCRCTLQQRGENPDVHADATGQW